MTDDFYNEIQVISDNTLLVKEYAPLNGGVDRLFESGAHEVQAVGGWQIIAVNNDEALNLFATLPEAKQREMTLALGAADARRCIVKRTPIEERQNNEIHTGKELLLLKRQAKPLAVFSEFSLAGGELIADILEETSLEVNNLPLHWRLFTKILPPYDRTDAIDVLLLALPSDEWRIDSYIFLLCWESECDTTSEFLRGLLLGYDQSHMIQYMS